MIVEDDVYRIEPGQTAEFTFSKKALQKILDSLPEDYNEVVFSLDHLGTIRAKVGDLEGK